MKLNKQHTLRTNGSGFWSKKKKNVRITQLELQTMDMDGETYGELRIYFNKKDWNIDKDGLIYTDDLFLKGLKKHLVELGCSVRASRDVDYSEQGMQDDDFVSCDVGQAFCKSKFAKNSLSELCGCRE